jgi:ferredoxin-nitrite reductase
MTTRTIDSDDPYGLKLGGPDQGQLPFLRPYRNLRQLSDPEMMKLRRHPFEVAQGIIETYSVEGVEALNAVPGEIERLKWVGLYPQRQGGDAFMMRIKVAGGVLTADQAREIGLIAEGYAHGPVEHPRFGNRYVDITTRQAVQVHWLTMASIPKIWQRFAEVGLTSIQACGDCARNVTACPTSGADPDEAVDTLGVARAISDFFTGNRYYANLPRKFKLAVCGCGKDCTRVEINDVALWAAERDGVQGFNLLVGGGLSDGERMATDIDVFVDEHEAVEISRAVAQLFGELGNREHRGLARMRYLVQELGPEQFRAELAARTDLELRTAGTERTTSYRRDIVGVHPERVPGLFTVGCNIPVGRLTGAELVEFARLAATYGDATIRLGVDQNLALTGVAQDRLEALLAEPLLEKFSPAPTTIERSVAACTGNEFCRYAIVETKERALKLAEDLDRKVAAALGEPGPSDAPLRIHLSGCSASCGQPQIADIGLRGAVNKGGTTLEEGYDVGLGGVLGPEASFVDWIGGAIPARSLSDALSKVIVAWAQGRHDGEGFTPWVRRTPVATLRQLIGEEAS